MAIVLGAMAPEWWPRAAILSASWRQRERQLEWLCFETSKPSSGGISPPIRLYPLIPCSSTNRGASIQTRASWGHSVQTTTEGVPKGTDLVLSCQGGLAQAGGFLTEAPTSAGLFCPEPSLCVCPQVLSLHIQPLHMRWVRKEARLSPFPKHACVCARTRALAFDRGNDSHPGSKVGVRATSVGERNRGEEAGWGQEAGWVLENQLPLLDALMGITRV